MFENSFSRWMYSPSVSFTVPYMPENVRFYAYNRSFKELGDPEGYKGWYAQAVVIRVMRLTNLANHFRILALRTLWTVWKRSQVNLTIQCLVVKFISLLHKSPRWVSIPDQQYSCSLGTYVETQGELCQVQHLASKVALLIATTSHPSGGKEKWSVKEVWLGLKASAKKQHLSFPLTFYW